MSDAHRPPHFNALATATLALAILVASLASSIPSVALPTLAETFASSFSGVQLIVIAYLGTLTVSVMVVGRLGDKLGLKPMLVAGYVLFIAATVLCATASSLWLLIAARAIQGVGAAFLLTLAMALMRHAAGDGKVGRAMGLLGTTGALGTALGPSVGGALIPLAGWPAIFWIQIPLLLGGLALTVVAVESPPRRVAPYTPRSWQAIREARLGSSMLANMLVSAVMMTTLIVGPFYLGLALKLDAMQVGLTMTAGPVVSILTGLPSGRLVDAVGSRSVLLAGLVLLLSGMLLMAFLPNMVGVAGYLLAVIVFTPGYQLFQAANTTAVLADAPSDHRGLISGALNFSRNVGLMGGAWLLGSLFATVVGTETLADASARDVASGLQWTFLVAGAAMFCAIGVSLPRIGARRR